MRECLPLRMGMCMCITDMCHYAWECTFTREYVHVLSLTVVHLAGAQQALLLRHAALSECLQQHRVDAEARVATDNAQHAQLAASLHARVSVHEELED